MKYRCIERWPCGESREVRRKKTFPFLVSSSLVIETQEESRRKALTKSFSHPKKNTTTSVYLTTGCLTIRCSHFSKSPLLASTNSPWNLPAYCFAGKGGSTIPGNDLERAVCKKLKCENRRWTVILVGSISGEEGGKMDVTE
ncbi:hypothetical protein AG1IA_05086 [Rhizoctonia solani AG-1 IA]|uniref:Uncharacterized protein n=1 Tax=Thanatephorus cucumeris (strain AG1-IA) TaxID=983506 RepID=L8WSD3_THACA|nr:hypothetical protein AG1IA_05086 [Rhizoctonia solani AG-1 IA]